MEPWQFFRALTKAANKRLSVRLYQTKKILSYYQMHSLFGGICALKNDYRKHIFLNY